MYLTLILKKFCSEYTLYLAILVKNNLFEDNYTNNHFTIQLLINHLV